MNINLNNLNGINGFSIVGSHDTFGRGSFGGGFDVGDYNKDGYADILVGEYNAQDSRSTGNPGVSYYIDGQRISNNVASYSIQDLVSINTAIIIENTETDPIMQDDVLGSINLFADVNNDGNLDIVISDVWADFNGNEAGRLYGIYNRDFVSNPFDIKAKIISPQDNEVGFYMTGSAYRIAFGRSLLKGDIDGDGKIDFITTSVSEFAYGYYGYVYVFFGGQTLPIHFTQGAFGSYKVLSIKSACQNNCFARSVFVGDFDQDGYDDIIISDSGCVNYIVSNKIHVIYGNPDFKDQSIFDVSLLSQETGFSITASTSAYTELRVGGLVDLNGDGKNDLILTEAGASVNGISNAGRIYIIWGTGNRNDFANNLDLSQLDNETGIIINGDSQDQYLGKWGITFCDFNHDGFNDLLITSSNNVYLLNGGENHFTTTKTISEITSSIGLEIIGSSTIRGVRTGDINGDGIDDIIVGAGGVVSIIYGEGAAVPDSTCLNPLNGIDEFYGTEFNDIITGSDTIAAIYGKGGNDTIYVKNINTAVHGGSGIDTVSYIHCTEGIVVDFSNTTQFTGIEIMQGSSHNDIVTVGINIEEVYTGNGNDTIYLKGLNNTFIHGGNGTDTLSFKYWTEGVEADFSTDQFTSIEVIQGSSHNDIITVGVNIEEVYTGGGDNTVYLKGLNTFVHGGNGTDTLSFRHWTEGIEMDFSTGQFTSIEIIQDSPHDDIIIAGTNTERVYTSGGNDIIYLKSLDTCIVEEGNGTTAISFEHYPTGLVIDLHEGTVDEMPH